MTRPQQPVHVVSSGHSDRARCPQLGGFSQRFLDGVGGLVGMA